ncbi:MAG: hypothetical protein FDW93_07040 [Bergeyella sp.]|nr:hypothetical protein [Bergeyella sp.]
MKKNPSLFGLLVAVVAGFVAFGIYFLFLSKKDHFLVDNPTGRVYYFRLNNGQEKIIPGKQWVSVEVVKGKNTIAVFDDKKNKMYDSIFVVNKTRGLINISHSEYYINRQYYGYNINKDSLLGELGKTKIDGKDYYGAPKLFNRLYTEDFYYNVDEKYDKVIKNIDKIESRTKIFRKPDFLVYYKEYYSL